MCVQNTFVTDLSSPSSSADSSLRTAGPQCVWAAKPDSVLQPAEPSPPAAAGSVLAAAALADPARSAFLSAATAASVSAAPAPTGAAVPPAAGSAAPSVPDPVSPSAACGPAAPTEPAALRAAAGAVALPAAAADAAGGFLGSFAAVVVVPRVAGVAAAVCVLPAALPPSSGRPSPACLPSVNVLSFKETWANPFLHALKAVQVSKLAGTITVIDVLPCHT